MSKREYKEFATKSNNITEAYCDYCEKSVEDDETHEEAECKICSEVICIWHGRLCSGCKHFADKAAEA